MKKFLIISMLLLTACSPSSQRKYGYDSIMPDELKDCKVFEINDTIKSLYVVRCGFGNTTCSQDSNGKHQTTVCYNQVGANNE